jgi:exosome complex component RRP41
MRCSMTVLPVADGSATFEAGNTKVLAAAYGPREAPLRSEAMHDRCVVKVEFSQAAFSSDQRRRRTKGDRRSLELGRVITRALETAIMTELMPRSQIDVNLVVLQSDGGVRSAALNAAVLALADAGIPMRDTMAACSAGYLDGTPILDINGAEESGGGPEVHVASFAHIDRVVLCQSDTKCALDAFESTLALAQEGCKVVAAVMREAMLRRTKELAATRAAERL